MSVLGGDFIGFSFDGHHSSDLGIIRVSDGSRYTDYLLPTFQDLTVQVPGGDGTYYFGSYDTSRNFSISIAFDSLKEEQISNLRKIFGEKKVGKLIFDEAPYKYYMVKVTSQPQLKYICFGKTGDTRIYKGEGTIQFTAYYPYAKSTALFLGATNLASLENKNEWAAASRLPQTAPTLTGSSIPVYNVGDLPMDWRARYVFPNVPTDIYMDGVGMLKFSAIAKQGSDEFIEVNSKTNLIEGLDTNGEKTGNIYNKFMTGGTFFKIPPMASELEKKNFISVGTSSCWKLLYDYIYY